MVIQLNNVLLGGLAAVALLASSSELAAAPKDLADFEVVIMGEGEFSGAATRFDQAIRKSDYPVWFMDNKPGDGVFFLGEEFQNADYDYANDGSTCFPGDLVYEINKPDTGYALTLTRNHDGDAEARIWFKANTMRPDDGQILYNLTLTDTGDDWIGAFPPAIGEPGYMEATEWLMQTDGKGKLKKHTCTGSGSGVSVSFTVTRTE